MKKKCFLFVYILCFLKANSQIRISETIKTDHKKSFRIDYNLFVKYNSTKSLNNITYIAYNSESNKIKETTVSAPINNQTGNLSGRISVVDNDLYELHIISSRINKDRDLVIVKRNVNNLNSSPIVKKVGHFKEAFNYTFLYFNESGKYIFCLNFKVTKNNYIIVLDEELNVIKTIDFPAYMRTNKFQLQDNGFFLISLILYNLNNLDIQTEESKGNSNLVFIIISPEGEKKVCKVQLKDDLTYTSVKYRYNYENNIIEAFFCTSEDDKEGVYYCEWNAKTGEIIKNFNSQYLISEVATDDMIDFYKKIKSKDLNTILVNKNRQLIRIFCKREIIFLKNSEFLVIYKDFYLNNGIIWSTKTRHNSDLIVKFNKNGKKEWFAFLPCLSDEKSVYTFDTVNNRLLFLSTARSINFPNGEYSSSFLKKGYPNILVLSAIDVKTGEFVKRKKIASIPDSNIYARVESDKLHLIVTSLTKKRTIRFGTLYLDDFFN